jgi:ribosome-associated protein
LTSKKLAKLVVEALEDIKGQSVVCIDVRKLTQITDYMVIATGTSTTHIKALSDAVVKKVKESGASVQGVEGRMQAEWVLVDLGDVVVHVMLAPVRALYNLEDLWNFDSGTGSKVEK